MLRDGSLEIKGENVPEFQDNVAETVRELEQEFKIKQFSKPDFFASAPFVDGLIGAQEFQKKGMQVHCMNSRVIYPMYGTYMPT